MLRREFFTPLLGLLGLTSAAVKSSQEQRSYYYSWLEDVTNDPDGFPKPEDCVTCNGKEYKHVRRVQTGPQGYVEVLKLRDGKPYAEDCWFDAANEKAGMKYKCKRSGARSLETTTKENKRWRTYLPASCHHEKLAIEVIFGSVECNRKG